MKEHMTLREESGGRGLGAMRRYVCMKVEGNFKNHLVSYLFSFDTAVWLWLGEWQMALPCFYIFSTLTEQGQWDYGQCFLECKTREWARFAFSTSSALKHESGLQLVISYTLVPECSLIRIKVKVGLKSLDNLSQD